MNVNYEANLFREAARNAIGELSRHGIAHLIAGSLAVWEYGYLGVTLDFDLIVPDVLKAAEVLSSERSGRLARVPEIEDRLQDKANGVIIDLKPAGKVLKVGCKVPFPTPAVVSDQLQFVTLEQLISLKLDSWINSPLRCLTDKTHVIELIIRRKLSRDLRIDAAVQGLYLEIWDAIKAEK